MASEINVDKITPQTGTTLELGDSGDTITVTGTLDGSGLTGLNATNLTSGTVPDARFPATLPAVSGANLTGIETGTDWQSTIVTGSTLTAVAGKGYWINTASNQCTITLPSSASVGDTIELVDYARTWVTNKIIINPNGLNYQGTTANFEYNTSGQALRIVYSGATKGWIPTSDDAVVGPTYDVDFLIIAGGGGGGSDYGSGGGAGGYRASFNSETSGGGGSSESALTLTVGTQYTVTVGAGGTGARLGTNGGDSVFSTITSIGGGNGTGENSGAVGNGGSGGGSVYMYGVIGLGTANQGFNGGSGPSGSPFTPGGGGGAGAVGGNGTSSSAGAGGNGVASTITGSSVTRAGGGGGGYTSTVNKPAGAGGSGGGGAGGATQAADGIAGTTNTGSGGGGGGGDDASNVGGNGGSGIIIIRMPTANYSGVTSGSPTVTTSGSDTILTYTGSGSYTA